MERAIDTVERLLERGEGPVYVRKQIVHNTHVVDDLAARDAVFVDELDEVPPGAPVVFSAHGVAPAVRDAELVGEVVEVRRGYGPVIVEETTRETVHFLTPVPAVRGS